VRSCKRALESAQGKGRRERGEERRRRRRRRSESGATTHRVLELEGALALPELGEPVVKQALRRRRVRRGVSTASSGGRRSRRKRAGAHSRRGRR